MRGSLSRRKVLTGLIGAAAVAGIPSSAGAIPFPPPPPFPFPPPPVPLLPLASILFPDGAPTVFHSPKLTPFVDELPIPPVLDGTRALTIDELATVHQFHRDLPAAPAFGYGGASYLGPTIEAQSGVETRLTVRNRLSRHVFAKDIDSSVHGAGNADRSKPRTTVHLHGGATPPQYDGHPEAVQRPGQQMVNIYPNRQEAAHLWYHDHAIGITRLNVYAGLAGMYLLRDQWDTGRPDNPLGLPAGEFEVPLVLQDKIFTKDGAPSMRGYTPIPEGVWEPGWSGDTGLVNGKVWPQMEVARGLYRFRVINASNGGTFRLFFSNHMRFWVIGNDGGLLDAPVRTTSIRMTAAERADILVDFGDLDPGETVELSNDEEPYLAEAVMGMATIPYFCRFKVGKARGSTGRVPRTLRGERNQPELLPRLTKPQYVRNLTGSYGFTDKGMPVMFTMNNLSYTDSDIEMPRQGTVEQWNFINLTPDIHPLHLHLVTFRVLSRQSLDALAYVAANPRPWPGVRWAPSAEKFLKGRPEPAAEWESGEKDTVLVDPFQVVRILVRFPTADELGFDPDAKFTPPNPLAGSAHHRGTRHGMGHRAPQSADKLQGYVWHCHFLGHEDHDMMLRYRLVR